jgi:hypothetical protein
MKLTGRVLILSLADPWNWRQYACGNLRAASSSLIADG